jgi:hypothetical protein
MDINIPSYESPIPLLEHGRGSVINLNIANRELLVGYPHPEGAAKKGSSSGFQDANNRLTCRL